MQYLNGEIKKAEEKLRTQLEWIKKYREEVEKREEATRMEELEKRLALLRLHCKWCMEQAEQSLRMSGLWG